MSKGTVFGTCPWCKANVSLQRLGDHRLTPRCRGAGAALEAKRRGLIRIGNLVKPEDWRVQAWLPLLLRARAPVYVLPTYGGSSPARKKNRREVWIPRWVNLLLATEPRTSAGEFKNLTPLVQLFRWARRDIVNRKAVVAVCQAVAISGNVGGLQETREAIFSLFVGANPGLILREARASDGPSPVREWKRHPLQIGGGFY